MDVAAVHPISTIETKITFAKTMVLANLNLFQNKATLRKTTTDANCHAKEAVWACWLCGERFGLQLWENLGRREIYRATWMSTASLVRWLCPCTRVVRGRCEVVSFFPFFLFFSFFQLFLFSLLPLTSFPLPLPPPLPPSSSECPFLRGPRGQATQDTIWSKLQICFEYHLHH